MVEQEDRVWREEQNELLTVEDAEKTNKAENQQAYQRKVLQKVKSWGGPCTSEEELHTAMQLDDEEKVVHQELVYFRLTHPTLGLQERDLLKKIKSLIQFNMTI